MDALTSYPCALLKLLQYRLHDPLYNAYYQIYKDASDFVLQEYKRETNANTLSLMTLEKFQETLHLVASCKAPEFMQYEVEAIRKQFPRIDRVPQEIVSLFAKKYFADKQCPGAYRPDRHLVPFREWCETLLKILAMRLLDNPILMDAYAKPSRKMELFAFARNVIDDAIVESIYEYIDFDVVMSAAGAGYQQQQQQQQQLQPQPQRPPSYQDVPNGRLGPDIGMGRSPGPIPMSSSPPPPHTTGSGNGSGIGSGGRQSEKSVGGRPDDDGEDAFGRPELDFYAHPPSSSSRSKTTPPASPVANEQLDEMMNDFAMQLEDERLAREKQIASEKQQRAALEDKLERYQQELLKELRGMKQQQQQHQPPAPTTTKTTQSEFQYPPPRPAVRTTTPAAAAVGYSPRPQHHQHNTSSSRSASSRENEQEGDWRFQQDQQHSGYDDDGDDYDDDPNQNSPGDGDQYLDRSPHDEEEEAAGTGDDDEPYLRPPDKHGKPLPPAPPIGSASSSSSSKASGAGEPQPQAQLPAAPASADKKPQTGSELPDKKQAYEIPSSAQPVSNKNSQTMDVDADDVNAEATALKAATLQYQKPQAEMVTSSPDSSQ